MLPLSGCANEPPVAATEHAAKETPALFAVFEQALRCNDWAPHERLRDDFRSLADAARASGAIGVRNRSGEAVLRTPIQWEDRLFPSRPMNLLGLPVDHMTMAIGIAPGANFQTRASLDDVLAALADRGFSLTCDRSGECRSVWGKRAATEDDPYPPYLQFIVSSEVNEGMTTVACLPWSDEPFR